MANQANATNAPLFDFYTSLSEEQLQGIKTTHARKKLMRKYEAAYDDAEAQVVAAQAELEQMMLFIKDNPSAGVNRFDVNTRIAIVARIKELEAARDFLKSDYKALFGEELS